MVNNTIHKTPLADGIERTLPELTGYYVKLKFNDTAFYYSLAVRDSLNKICIKKFIHNASSSGRGLFLMNELLKNND